MRGDPSATRGIQEFGSYRANPNERGKQNKQESSRTFNQLYVRCEEIG